MTGVYLFFQLSLKASDMRNRAVSSWRHACAIKPSLDICNCQGSTLLWVLLKAPRTCIRKITTNAKNKKCDSYFMTFFTALT